MRHLKTDNGHDLYCFDSNADMRGFDNPKFYSCFDHTKGFVGEDLPNWDAVKQRVDRCWAEGLQTIEDYTKALTEAGVPAIKSHKRVPKFSFDEGDDVDIEKMMAGEAFYKQAAREESGTVNEVTVVTDTTTPQYHDAMDILWRGAAALALTRILEERGYRVELWVVNGSYLFSGRQTPVMTACKLKACEDPLDLSTLVNTIGGWFYRTVTFTTLYTICEIAGQTPAHALGSAYYPTEKDLDLISTDPVRIYSSGVFSRDGALDMIRARLQDFVQAE
jgi:hypothetical protein